MGMMSQRLVGAHAAASRVGKAIAATLPTSRRHFTAMHSMLRPHRRSPLQQLVVQLRPVHRQAVFYCHSAFGRHCSSRVHSAGQDARAHGTSTSEDAAGTADGQTRQPRRDFMIRNDWNDVNVLRCETSHDLKYAMEELRSLPHFCVAGETNAGKSSMLNHLMKKKLARSSSVSCKTRTVDMFDVNSKLVVTDLPGIPSRDNQGEVEWERDFAPLVFEYLRECPSLRALLYLHDIRWKVSPAARDFLRRVRWCGVPVLLVLTKDDKLLRESKDGTESAAAEAELRLKLTTKVRRGINFAGLHVHYSVVNALPKSRKGRRVLLRLLEQMVEADSRDDCARILADIAAKKQAAKQGDSQAAKKGDSQAAKKGDSQAAMEGDEQAAMDGRTHGGAQGASTPPLEDERPAPGSHAQQRTSATAAAAASATAAAAAMQPAAVDA